MPNNSVLSVSEFSCASLLHPIHPQSSIITFFHFAVHTYSFVPLYCLQTILTSSLLSPISSYPHSQFLGRISFVVLSSSPFFLGSAYIAVGSRRRACGLREGVASVLVGVEGHQVERARRLYKGSRMTISGGSSQGNLPFIPRCGRHVQVHDPRLFPRLPTIGRSSLLIPKLTHAQSLQRGAGFTSRPILVIHLLLVVWSKINLVKCQCSKY